MIHPAADVQTTRIGEDTRIWQFAVVLAGASIGNNCNINCHTFIENDVVIGNNVTVKSGVYLWDGILVEDDVFIGPNVTFTNDKYPRSKQYPEAFTKTVLKKRVSIGAGAIILGGVTIGEMALVAAGAMVTKDVPARALVMGSPARIVAWVNEDGTKMKFEGNLYHDKDGGKWQVLDGELVAV